MMPVNPRLRLARLSIGAALLLAATTQQGWAQQLGGARPVEIPFAQIGAGIVLCSLAAFAIILLMKRGVISSPFRLTRATRVLPSWRSASTIKVLESRRMSPHADVCRFVVDDREYVVIVTQAAATIIRELPAQASSPPGERESVD